MLGARKELPKTTVDKERARRRQLCCTIMIRSVKEKLDIHFPLPLNQYPSRGNSCQQSMKKLSSTALKLCGFTAGSEFSLGSVRMTVFSFAFQRCLSLPHRFKFFYTKDIDLNQLGHLN